MAPRRPSLTNAMGSKTSTIAGISSLNVNYITPQSYINSIAERGEKLQKQN